MNITRATTDDKKKVFLMTHSIQAGKMSDLEGQIVEPVDWALYDDLDKKTGELKTVLSVLTPDGKVYGTISQTFISSFLDLADALGDNAAFEVCSGTTKNGRTFIYPIPA